MNNERARNDVAIKDEPSAPTTGADDDRIPNELTDEQHEKIVGGQDVASFANDPRFGIGDSA